MYTKPKYSATTDIPPQDEISESLQRDIDRIDSLWLDGLRQFGGPFLAGERFTAEAPFHEDVVFSVGTLLADHRQ